MKLTLVNRITYKSKKGDVINEYTYQISKCKWIRLQTFNGRVWNMFYHSYNKFKLEGVIVE